MTKAAQIEQSLEIMDLQHQKCLQKFEDIITKIKNSRTNKPVLVLIINNEK